MAGLKHSLTKYLVGAADNVKELGKPPLREADGVEERSCDVEAT